MKVKVLTEGQLLTYKFTDDSILICISDPGEELPESINRCPVVLPLEFKDKTPDEATEGETLYDQDDLLVCVQLLEDPELQEVLVYSTNSTARSSAVALGLLAALDKEQNTNDLMYAFVKANPTAKPNYWVVAWFDFALGLSGKLTTAVDDYEAAGLVVNSTGLTIHSND